MYLQDYPPDKKIDTGKAVSCPKDGMSGVVCKVFGKKCSIWPDGAPLNSNWVTITYKMSELVLDNHPDYKYNRKTNEIYLHKKNTGKKRK